MEHNQGDYTDNFTQQKCHKFQFCVFYGVIWLAEKVVAPYRAAKRYQKLGKLNEKKEN
ncbi:Hypothetical protein PACV_424 [Pacmanvirus A23]|uniref:Hypothetical protein n=1 Tax=Pacmanvirus A23 TaxID=1932881 RepID=UPI000A095089|nr:Hypothetical protein B9W72_gp420 [Pacmanvirus A23]SIP86137.1 Hypothetical protein PACV_424 [Pacmanvirus A23]